MLKEAIQKRDIEFIRKYSKTTLFAQIAEDLEVLESTERVVFFRLLSTDVSGEVFSYLPQEIKEDLIQNFSDKMIATILDELYTDEIADLLEEVPSNLSKRILKNTDKETRSAVNRILQYSDDVIGSIMSIDIVNLNAKLTCGQAIKKIRLNKDQAELVHYYYVVNKNKHLVGAVTLEDLVFNDPKMRIDKITFPVPFVHTYDKKEHGALIFAENDMSVIPVINSSKRVIGMVTSDDIIDVLQEEATEDMYKMAGISSQNIEKDYLKTSVFKLVKSRVIWLIILMLGSTLSQVVIDQFTGAMEHSEKLRAIGLGIFVSTIVSVIPVIAGSAGNAGSQAATTIIRAISLGEINGKKILSKVLLKEIAVGTIIGTILMILNFARLMVYFSITKELFDSKPLLEHGVPASNEVMSNILFYQGILIVSFAASISILIVIVFSKLLGSLIPLLAAKFGKDPAVMSAPILATMTDATSTFIFFGITISIFLFLPL